MVNGVAFDQKDTILTSDTIGQNLRSFKIKEDGSLKLQQVIDTRKGLLNSRKKYDSQQKLIQHNQVNQSLVTYWAGVDIVKLEEYTNQLITVELFIAQKANVIVAGGLVSHSGEYLFLTSYGDKSISVCKKQN
ncbi:hypothetical protein ABPG72_022735 [Tetrahymena utriculariae]